MAGVTVSRAWQTVKPHVPLIKFRKGGLASKDPLAAETVSKQGGGTASKAAATPRPVYEDYQLPKKYRRAPLTEEEIAYINVRHRTRRPYGLGNSDQDETQQNSSIC